jgi:ABC-type multidrug transport system fused ATPase/permease subunit
MTLFTLAIMIPGMTSGPVYGRYVRKLNKQISDVKAESSAIAEEAFANIRTVKAFATEDRECQHYYEKNEDIFEKARKTAVAYGLFNFFMQFVMFGSLDALVYFAAWLNSRGGLTVGQFTSFQFYMFSFLMNFMMMASVVGEVMGVVGTTEALA